MCFSIFNLDGQIRFAPFEVSFFSYFLDYLLSIFVKIQKIIRNAYFNWFSDKLTNRMASLDFIIIASACRMSILWLSTWLNSHPLV
jgi:hypothetical protein